uniref:Reticulon n=1 Tax=Denticeps clupeoides TaxID=299321 RepID=A0AAY4CC46_9TELE
HTHTHTRSWSVTVSLGLDLVRVPVLTPVCPAVLDLLYWRECRRSGLVFGGLQLLLLCLTQFSVVSVCAYIALATLSTTISFRIYKSILQAVQKSDEGHPFKSYLEVDVALTPAQMSAGVEKIQLYATCLLKELRRLFLVQDLVDSVKFAVLMWLPTYVGALFNGLTLLILGKKLTGIMGCVRMCWRCL